MRVVKRSGRVEDMRFDNVTNRIKNLTYGLSGNCDSSKVAQQVFSSMYDNITTQEIDILSAEICIGMITSDPITRFSPLELWRVTFIRFVRITFT
jgi:hypothetical protein